MYYKIIYLVIHMGNRSKAGVRRMYASVETGRGFNLQVVRRANTRKPNHRNFRSGAAVRPQERQELQNAVDVFYENQQPMTHAFLRI